MDIQNLPGTGINASHRVYSNYFADNYIIQNTCLVQPKNLLIDVLRRRFLQDSRYTYRMDKYGFPLTPDLTGKSIEDTDTTKILVSDGFRYDVKFYPNMIVKNGGGAHKQISFNQEGTYKYRPATSTNKYGKQVLIKIPTHKIYAGLWEMDFSIVLKSKSRSELEEIIEIVAMELQYSSWNELRANGLLIKSLNISSGSIDDDVNDKIYGMDINLQTLSEWRVEIPIENLIERIVFYLDSTRTASPPKKTIADVQALKSSDIIEIAILEI